MCLLLRNERNMKALWSNVLNTIAKTYTVFTYSQALENGVMSMLVTKAKKANDNFVTLIHHRHVIFCC